MPRPILALFYILTIFQIFPIFSSNGVEAVPQKNTKRPLSPIPSTSKPKPTTKNPVERVISNMILYEHELNDEPNIQYKKTPWAWSKVINFEDANGKPKYKRMCAVGAWLIYKRAACGANSLDDVSLFTADEMTCISTNETGKIRSAQWLTHAGEIGSDSMSFFPGAYFQGFAPKIHNLGEYPAKTLTSVGKKRWMLTLDDKDTFPRERFCIVPPQDFQGVPVCLMTSFADGKTLKNVKVHVKPGCSKNLPESAKIPMEQCYDSNEGLVYPLKESIPVIVQPPPPQNETTPPPVTPVTNQTLGKCPDVDSIFTPENIELILHRQTSFTTSEDPMEIFRAHMHIPGKYFWLAEFFFKSVRILQTICDRSVIEPEYLNLFAGLYMWHYGNVIEANVTIGADVDFEEYREMLHDMDGCYQIALRDDFDSVKLYTLTMFKNYKNIRNLEQIVETKLGYREKFDHIMEINWFMINMVGSICYKALDYDRNFLTRFVTMFSTLYLQPVRQKWTEPDANLSILYRYLFGGFDMKKSLTKLGLCTVQSLELSGLIGHYPRPFEQKHPFIPSARIDLADEVEMDEAEIKEGDMEPVVSQELD